MMALLAAIVFTLSITAINTLPVPTTEKYSRSEQLDSKGLYMVYWNHNDTHITFEVHVQTKGYVGFGISPNGKMYPSDVVIGWVKDGRTYFSDRHTSAFAAPELDASQDWFLIHGEEDETRTILKFVRKLDTCDEDDLPIDDQTTRLIYSFHPHDPVNETSLMYHGADHRGTKSVSLLNPSLPPASFKNEDVKILEFRLRNYIIPPRQTTYTCMGFELPHLGGKHHVIEFEPVITPGNEGNVHHMIVSKCNGSHPDLDMTTAVCAGPERDKSVDWPHCESFALWAYGGKPFYFPENVGFPIGQDGDTFFQIQMHYNNPALKTGMIDSSGMRIKLTPQLRQHDASGFSIAHQTNKRQVIPPQEKAFITRAFCSPQCTTSGLDQDIKVIAGFQHAHLLGVGITTRHFRNGVEIEPLIEDPYYDFNFQTIRPIAKEKVIKPGDSFIIECTLNSMGRQKATFGGLSTLEEMCMSYFFVYPAHNLTGCGSAPEFDTFNITSKSENKIEEEIYNKFYNMDWSVSGAHSDFRKRLDDSDVQHYCSYKHGKKQWYEIINSVEHVEAFNRTAFTSRVCLS